MLAKGLELMADYWACRKVLEVMVDYWACRKVLELTAELDYWACCCKKVLEGYLKVGSILQGILRLEEEKHCMKMNLALEVRHSWTLLAHLPPLQLPLQVQSYHHTVLSLEVLLESHKNLQAALLLLAPGSALELKVLSIR